MNHKDLQRALRPRALPIYDENEIKALVELALGAHAEKTTAGKKSGLLRRRRAGLRHLFVKVAFNRLKRPYQIQPFSDQSIDALQEEYRKLLAEGGDPELLMARAPFKADRDTLIKT
jgi:hypothetical protein